MVAGSDAAMPDRITPVLLARGRLLLAGGRRAGRALLDGLRDAKATALSYVPERFHAITDEVAKFGIIGLINLVVNFAVFNALLVAVNDSEVKATIIAAIVATTSAYFLNRYWTYRHRPKSTLRREYALFFFFNVIGMLIQAGCVWVAKYGFHSTSLLVFNTATFVGIVLGTVFRFWAYRTHVFKDAPADGAAQSTATGTTAAEVAVAAPSVALAGIAMPAAALELDLDSEFEADEFETDEFEDGEFEDSEFGTDEFAADAFDEHAGDDDSELRDALVQLELDDMLDRGPDPSTRH